MGSLLTVEELIRSLDEGPVSFHQVSSQKFSIKTVLFGPFVVEEHTFYQISRPEEVEDYQVEVSMPSLCALQWEEEDQGRVSRRVSKVIYVTHSKVRDEPLSRVVSYLNHVDSCELMGLGERIQAAVLGNSKGFPALARVSGEDVC